MPWRRSSSARSHCWASRSSPAVVATGRVWPIYAVIFFSGIARSFLQPARSALGAELVPRVLYPNAVTWRSSTWQLAEVVGPAIGGLVYGFGSATAAYGVDAALMAVGVALAGPAATPPAAGPASERVFPSRAWQPESGSSAASP